MHVISYMVLSDSPSPAKKFAPSLTGGINAQSSQWNNGKMKITYNFAYLHTETFNFSFAQEAFIVYFFVPTSKIMSNAKY